MFSARAIAVTALVALLGGIAGALCGAGIMGALALVRGVPLISGREDLVFFGLAGALGFVHGFILGPLLSWILLRDAPLWRAIGETALAASAAAAIAMLARLGLPAASACALGASLAAAGRLKFELRNRKPAVHRSGNG